ncbi:MAG: hypothetical protein QF619_09980, partial [Candidatus Binatia bacterium]|nr:hypothetical protein [Candidatus Binatia bacterium]
TVGFVLLALKYIKITWRNSEGGGVVTMTTKAFGPKWGCMGGDAHHHELFPDGGYLRGLRFSVYRRRFSLTVRRI